MGSGKMAVSPASKTNNTPARETNSTVVRETNNTKPDTVSLTGVAQRRDPAAGFLRGKK